MGYSSDSLSHDASYKVGDVIEIRDDMQLFVISRKKHKLDIDISEIDDISVTKNDLFCYTYNKDNSICDVLVPQFNKRGYNNYWYTDSKNSSNNTIMPGTFYKARGTLYPVYKAINRIPSIDVKESFAVNKAYIDVEKSCGDEYVKRYTNYIQDIEKIMPFLFNYQKIIFHGDIDFFKKIIFGGEYTFGVTAICGMGDNCDSFVDNIQPSIIRCYNDGSFDEYLSIIHELFHSVDSRYKYHFEKYISDEDDIVQLFNKYESSSLAKHSLPVYSINDKPLRFYAYENTKEFFAELMTFYYINYIDTNYKLLDIKYERKIYGYFAITKEAYFRGNFPDDMKSVAEKYYCIIKNDFDKSKCYN